MLPLLWHDLEEYAADEAVARIAARPMDHLLATWRDLAPEEIEARLWAAAQRRWESKVRFARHRIAKLGWVDACHHTALEILGYRFNRVGMLKAAGRWPLAVWADAGIGPEEAYATLLAEQALHLQGVRPLNHPRRRLAAYAKWARTQPDWPGQLRSLGESWPEPGGLTGFADVANARKTCGYAVWLRKGLGRLGAADRVRRPRADNLWGDGLLPLLAAAGPVARASLGQWWSMGWPGDQPDRSRQVLRMLGLGSGRQRPLCWGAAQGLLLAQAEATGRRT